jgi:hypothetical protein
MNDLVIPDSRKAVEALQKHMLEMPQIELQTDHYFADGMYARVVARPAGTLIVGKVHKKEHFYIVAKGKVQIGKNVYEAGTIILSKPGTKRAVFALEDSVCMTVHRTNKKNLVKMEKELIEDDPTALFDSTNKLKVEELT